MRVLRMHRFQDASFRQAGCRRGEGIFPPGETLAWMMGLWSLNEPVCLVQQGVRRRWEIVGEWGAVECLSLDSFV